MLDELPARDYVLHGRRAVINFGSVGQPRDNNAKPCYAVLHRDRVTWRRVPYDIRKTVDKIRAQPKLDAAPSIRHYVGRGAGPGPVSWMLHQTKGGRRQTHGAKAKRATPPRCLRQPT